MTTPVNNPNSITPPNGDSHNHNAPMTKTEAHTLVLKAAMDGILAAISRDAAQAHKTAQANKQRIRENQ